MPRQSHQLPDSFGLFDINTRILFTAADYSCTMGLDLSACAPKFGLAGNIAVLAFGMISLVAAFSGNAIWVVVAGILIT